MKYKIDTTTWKRREHYEFFNGMDDPFWGTVVPVDFTECYLEAKKRRTSFFLCSLHRILTAVNRIEAFRYRIENGGSGLLRPNPREPDYRTRGRQLRLRVLRVLSDLHEFIRAAERETERVKAADGLCLGAGAGRTDLIYFSAVPWFAFTEMKHARSANRGDSIPRISTGKLTRSGDRLTMPVSLDVHHGFIDGRQAGEFFALLENRE